MNTLSDELLNIILQRCSLKTVITCISINKRLSSHQYMTNSNNTSIEISYKDYIKHCSSFVKLWNGPIWIVLNRESLKYCSQDELNMSMIRNDDYTHIKDDFSNSLNETGCLKINTYVYDLEEINNKLVISDKISSYYINFNNINLKRLSISDSNIESINWLPDSITHLDISYCYFIVNIERLFIMPNIQYVDIRGYNLKIKDRVMKLAELINVKY